MVLAQRQSRRSILKLGVIGVAVLATGGYVATALTDGTATSILPEAKHLNAAMQQLMHRVAEAVLDGILPRNAGERQALLQQTVVMLDQTVSTMPVHLQKEVKDLLGMLSIAPTRFLLGGRWAGWANASVADTTAFLTGLRTSRVELKRFIYVTLQELTTLSFYTLPQTWKLFGYPGPLLHGPGEEV